MSKKWLSSGRYKLTRGVFKRLWVQRIPLSEVIVPSVNVESSTSVPPPPEESRIRAESSQDLHTEESVPVLRG